MRNYYVALAILAFSAGAATNASAFSKAVEKACAGDYQNYCAQYVPNSPQVRRCFESNRKGLSQWCIRALVDAGEVPAKYLKK